MMDGSQGGSNSPAPFLVKTYEMVDDQLTISVVSWSDNGESFVVWNPPEFARDLLPKYFKHNNFSSFVRQLNTYGFRKIDPEQWEFANEEFVRGQRHLLKNIYRRKPIHSHSTQKNAAVPLTDSEREEFEKEIERLKRDNSLLQTDLERHKEENQAYECEMKSLGQCLVEIDRRQKQLVNFFAQQLNKCEFTASVMQQSETHNKKRRLLVPSTEDHQYTCSGQTITSEVIEKLDSSIGFWENFLQEVNQTPVEDVYEFGVLPQQSPVIISEMNIRQCSPRSHLSSSPSREIRSSPELSSPATPSICIGVDSRPKSSGMDVNLSPDNILDGVPSRDRVEGSTTRAVPPAANDVFWQQFFTETPGSSDAQEVQSERNERGCRRNGSEDHQRQWWNVDSLAKQMGHLAPAEKT